VTRPARLGAGCRPLFNAAPGPYVVLRRVLLFSCEDGFLVA